MKTYVRGIFICWFLLLLYVADKLLFFVLYPVERAFRLNVLCLPCGVFIFHYLVSFIAIAGLAFLFGYKRWLRNWHIGAAVFAYLTFGGIRSLMFMNRLGNTFSRFAVFDIAAIILGTLIAFVIVTIMWKNHVIEDLERSVVLSAIKRHKIIFIIILVLISGLIMFALERQMMDRTVHSAERPGGFPEILVACPNAVDVKYSVTYRSRKEVGIFGMIYFVVDPCPPVETYGFIKDRLERNGWSLLGYDLLNPHYKPTLGIKREIPEKVDSEYLASLTECDKGQGFVILSWADNYWIDDRGNVVCLGVCYYVDLKKGIVNTTDAEVHLTYLRYDSWVKAYLERYKSLHPAEFGDVNDAGIRAGESIDSNSFVPSDTPWRVVE
jgi:hypothetical protein